MGRTPVPASINGTGTDPTSFSFFCTPDKDPCSRRARVQFLWFWGGLTSVACFYNLLYELSPVK